MIKKLNILIIILVLGSSISSYSQIYLGGRVGINMSTISIQPEIEDLGKVSEIVTKITPGVALLGYFEIGPYFAIQPELVYNRKGQKTNIDLRDTTSTLRGEWNYSYDYFELPLMFKLSLKSEGFDPFFEFGAYYGYLMQAQFEGEAFLNDNQIVKENYFADFNSTANETFNRDEYGFKIGIGATMAMSKGVAFFSIRYTQGLTDVMNYTVKPEDYQKTYHRVFQLTVGYAFGLRLNTEKKVYYY